MDKHELLVPAGNMDCLYQAVYHGADAVYIAGQNFGARKFATNFSNSELIDAIKFCHLYGVKVFVTMNTLIKDNEVDDFLNQIRFLHKNNVDAVIVQDFGMICLLREMFPNLEIHASTQANNSSREICKLFYELGVKRVVFSRELSIDEIDSIDVPIEKEAFIHGALCVSYSGCCLMSSMLGGRSGNRGECAGSCRMPYTLMYDKDIVKSNQYLLSMKELNTSNSFSRLLKSSIYSFKIEGRMKGALYVGYITSLYRRLIDGEYVNLKIEEDRLKTIFNREFTSGHLFNNNGSSLINSKTPNHIGLKVGIATVSGDKIKLVLQDGRRLFQNDAIRFLNSNKGMIVNYLYDSKMMLCSSCYGVCYVDNKVGLDCDDELSITQDSTLDNEFIINSSVRRIPVKFNVYAHCGENIVVSIDDGFNKIEVSGAVIDNAISSPTSCGDIEKHLGKLGNTPFVLEKINFDISDNIFIQVKQLNDIRRDLVDKLIDIRKNTKINEYVENEVKFKRNSCEIAAVSNKKFVCSVFYESQLKKCLSMPFERIYVYSFDLYNKYKSDERVYYVLERCLENYEDLPERYLVSDLFKYSNQAIGSYPLNVTNIYSAFYLKKIGLRVIPLSVELSNFEINNLVSLYKEKFGYVEFELLQYGRVENMIVKDNILDIRENDINYSLVDLKNREFPVLYSGGKTHIYNCEFRLPLDVKSITYRFDFIDEKDDDIEKIVKLN